MSQISIRPTAEFKYHKVVIGDEFAPDKILGGSGAIESFMPYGCLLGYIMGNEIKIVSIITSLRGNTYDFRSSGG